MHAQGTTSGAFCLLCGGFIGCEPIVVARQFCLIGWGVAIRVGTLS